MEKHVISIIGLGYVGLTTAIAFSQSYKVIAFDIDLPRIDELKKNHDRNEEIKSKDFANKNITFTANDSDLKEANIYFICVPTPLNKNKIPDLTNLLNASRLVGKYLKKNDIVVYESTVYPGATEEQCIPCLEEISKLKCGNDFFVGYSPERINPGDPEHTFQNIIKIVSATDSKTLLTLIEMYKTVITAGVFPVSSIKVAEACKVIENTQRDINIAFMNEIAIMLHSLNIDLGEVISAMKTKWNALSFSPGLVGGHCIGVNSYYLMYKANELGYYPDLIATSRKINESLSTFIVDQTIKKLINLDILIKKARIAVLGLTYKENCNDLRDTRVINIINELLTYNIKVFIHDPIADPVIAKKEYGIDLSSFESIKDVDAIIIAVAHNYYKQLAPQELIKKLNTHGIIMDIKEMLNPADFANSGVQIWRL